MDAGLIDKFSQVMNQYNFKDYVSLPRWASYYYQISTLTELSPERILEIGLGSRAVYTLLKEMGFSIASFDNNRELSPDILGDIRNISGFFRENQFDCVCCFQVLEHLPFNEFESIIGSISKIASKYAVISLPYSGYTFGAEFRISRVGERIVNFTFRIPRFWCKHSYDGIHYWEIGKKGYPLSRIEWILSKHYKIKEKKFIKPNKAIIIFVLEKK